MTLMSLARYEQQLKWVAFGLGILSVRAICFWKYTRWKPSTVARPVSTNPARLYHAILAVILTFV